MSLPSIEFLLSDGSPASVTIATYPGGEFRIEGEELGTIAVVRGADPADLVVVAVWANDVRRMGGAPIGFVPYLPASRADHEEHARGFDAAAYARLLNAAELERVVCVDPHSDVMPALVERCSVIEAADLIAAASLHVPVRELSGLIAPDEGSLRRCFRVAERFGLPVFMGRKHRDFDTGHLSGFSCDPLPPDGSFLVVDDICDGGGTFRGLAEAAGVGRDRLHLWVTHGIFSGHASGLMFDYSTLTTTDSHPGCRNIPGGPRVVPLLAHLIDHLDRLGGR